MEVAAALVGGANRDDPGVGITICWLFNDRARFTTSSSFARAAVRRVSILILKQNAADEFI